MKLYRGAQAFEELHLLPYIQKELNVKEVVYSTDESAHVKLTAKPNGKLLGPRFGKDFGRFAKAFGKLDEQSVLALEGGGEV